MPEHKNSDINTNNNTIMTAKEHAHAFEEVWSIEQSLAPDMPQEIALLYCEKAAVHSAATWTTEQVVELELPQVDSSSDEQLAIAA